MKKVANTIKAITTGEFMERVMDPKDDLTDVVERMKAHWAYDLYNRRPGPALLDDGVLKPTDLDLACFLSALADRKAVINLPKYQNRRAATSREGEHVVSKDNRHGHVVGLTSNKDVFSFSVRIKDYNVVTSGGSGDGVGAFRNFMLVDLDGTWHDGWRKITFVPTAKENDFLGDKGLWTGNSVYFDNWVHPNRWTAFYGKWYLMTKILVARLRAESSARRAEEKKKLEGGLRFPPGYMKARGGSETVGPEKVELVPAFEAVVDVEVPTDYPPYPNTVEGLVAAHDRSVKLTFADVPDLNFACRATELAFADKADSFSVVREEVAGLDASSERSDPSPEPLPYWISGTKWERGYKEKGKRTVWNRLIFHQHVPFTKGFALLYRVHVKSERVAA